MEDFIGKVNESFLLLAVAAITSHGDRTDAQESTLKVQNFIYKIFKDTLIQASLSEVGVPKSRQITVPAFHRKIPY